MDDNTNCRITVLMGIYNCADTLEEALDSLLSQTYQRFKVVLCDDGSSDETVMVAERYVDRFPDKFILIKNDHNMGLAYTLNRCLELADTEYIARMDGDDISLPERFEKEIEYLDAHPEMALVSCPMIHFDESGDYGYHRSSKAHTPTKYDFVRSSPFCHAPCMMRTEALRSVNGYDESLRRAQDYNLWFRLYAAGYKGHNLAEPMYKMRDGEAAYKRRTLKSKFKSASLMSKGFRMLRLPLYYQIFALRPIIVGLLPRFIYKPLHAMKTSR